MEFFLESKAMSQNLKVGIVGLGAIGLEIAKTIDSKKLPNMSLVSVSSRDLTKAQNKLDKLQSKPKLTNIDETVMLSDIIIESAPAAIFDEIAEVTIEAGKFLFRQVLERCYQGCISLIEQKKQVQKLSYLQAP